VKYGALEKIKKAINEVKKLQSRYPQNTYNLEMNSLFGLHKANIIKYNWENEIRILRYDIDIRKYCYDVRFYKNNLIQTIYLKLPLFKIDKNVPKEGESQKIPDLKIAKIYFGPNINYPDIYPNRGFNDFKNELWHYIYGKFGNILDYKDLIDINEFFKKMRKDEEL
jgi:hypothetical protein